jgi:hypothetical protein
VSSLHPVIAIKPDYLDPDNVTDEPFPSIEAPPLPQIKSWKIEAEPKSLALFDLTQAETLELHCREGFMGTWMTYLPSQLHHLTLNEVRFNSESISSYAPLVMPQLTTLRLMATNFDGPMQNYLKLPKLKNLYLEFVYFMIPEDTTIIEEEDLRTAQVLSEAAFFGSLPELELLSLCQMPADEALTTSLQQCSRLRELTIILCEVESFLSSLITALTDNKSFPSLNTLAINYSWTNTLPISFMEFTKRCAHQRPGMFVFGNEKPPP